MSDLISREEVLNLIDTAFESGAFDGRYAYENLIDAVQNLIHPLETDLISRQAVLNLFAEKCDTVRPYHEVWQAVKELPSVEQERKTGKWLKVVDEETSNSTTWHYKCSLCESHKGWDDYYYCPNCGAKMEGADG